MLVRSWKLRSESTISASCGQPSSARSPSRSAWSGPNPESWVCQMMWAIRLGSAPAATAAASIAPEFTTR